MAAWVMPGTNEAEQTRSALLAVAGEIFAQRGFEASTVAEITRAASANVASVNYHFGDKLGLYVAVLRHSLPQPSLAAAQQNGVSDVAQFRNFVSEFIRSFIGQGRPTWCTRLMAREIAQPTPALAEVVRKVMRPNHLRLRKIIGALLNQSEESEPVRLAAQSVVGQCVHWALCQPVLPHIWPELRMDEEQVKRIVAHVTNFSLAGLKAMRAVSPRQATRKRK